MIFVDSGAWFALFVNTDQHHDVARAWFAQTRVALHTTDYVVAETLTLFQSRKQRLRISEFVSAIRDHRIVRVHRITSEDFSESLEVILRFSDKSWSFTDCTSKVVMERLGISIAFTFDHHFKQFGNVAVVPESAG